MMVMTAVMMVTMKGNDNDENVDDDGDNRDGNGGDDGDDDDSHTDEDVNGDDHNDRNGNIFSK